jgi:hypothetical protein
METKTFTVDNILVLMCWCSDMKVYVKYFHNNKEIVEWSLLKDWQILAIISYRNGYCEENNLILWSY